MKKDVKEVEEVKEANAGVSSGADSCGVAAFFDLDGTLTALPSLEQRFFRILRQRKEISRRNYLLWLKEAARLAPSGIQEMLQVNKMYLREVRTIRDFRDEDSGVCSSLKSGHGNKRLTTASSQRDSGCAQRDPRLPVPVFFGEAVDRVAWHAKQGHAIVLVSGTLEPLARETARDLEAELAARDLAVTIRVCATRLEEIEDRWTGNILGEAMRGHAKARAARRLAAEL